MNASEFNELNSDTKFKIIKNGLKNAVNPFDVLGSDPQKTYKRLARTVHPDMGGDSEAFMLLSDLMGNAEAEIAMGVYGAKTPSIVSISGIEYPLLKKLGSGDTSDVWLTEGDCVVKIVRDTADIDLLDSEFQTLKYLAGHTLIDDHDTPEPIAFDENGAVYHYDTEYLCPPEDLVTLERLATDYSFLLPVKAIGWLWRRILGELMRPHALGIVSASLTPDNLLVDTTDHRIVHIDWKFASKNENVIELISDKWAKIYPPSIFLKEKPNPAVDIYMAAQCMLYANTAMPEPMQNYFEALTGKWGTVPYDIQKLLDIWNDVMYRHLGWKKEFVVMNYAPAVLDWSWFWG